jgi:hypothetical protein
MKRCPLVLATAVLAAALPLTGASQADPDRTLQGQGTAVPAGFSGRIACEFSGDSGALFRSDWMTRHWITIDGQLIEFRGDAKMSDAGWFQTFTSDEITVTLSLRRLGDRGETVPMRGEVVVAKAGESTTYQMTGYCGA